MRKYSKRTKSTARKTYQQYLEAREKLGYKVNTINERGQKTKSLVRYGLHEAMNERQFNALYDRLLQAKKAGEIKSQAFQELMRREKLLSTKQARVFAIAQQEKLKEEAITALNRVKDRLSEREYKAELRRINSDKVTIREALTFDIETIRELAVYIEATKETGIYGGDYE